MLQHFRAGGGREVTGDKHVLVRQWYAQEWCALAGGQAHIGGSGLCQRDVGIGGQESAQAVLLLNALQKVLSDLNAGDFARGQLGGQLGHAQVV